MSPQKPHQIKFWLDVNQINKEPKQIEGNILKKIKAGLSGKFDSDFLKAIFIAKMVQENVPQTIKH